MTTKELLPGKGLKGENCNRTACQAPNSAHYYNNQTRKYYCFECACTIEAYAQIEEMSFYEGTVADLIKPLTRTEKISVARLQMHLQEPTTAIAEGRE